MYLKFSNFTSKNKRLKPLLSFVNRKENVLNCCILLSLFLLNVLYRIFVLNEFAFVYTDSDQVVMWCGTRDFYLGEFHEPGYYGQNYNSMIEALFASPFLKWISPAYTLPVVTSFLTFFPYFLISIVCYCKKLTAQSFIIISIPLLLPPEYDFITSIPRGFVTGIFFAVIGSIAVYYPEKKWGFFFFSFLNMIGIFLNPNAVLITLPIGIVLLSINYKNALFYVYTFTGAAIGAVPSIYTIYFYRQHPKYIVHGLNAVEFSIEYFKQGLLNLNRSFAYVVPIYWGQSIVILLIFAAFIRILFLQKKVMESAAMCILFVFIIVTLGIQKIYEGDETVFFHYSRMFLALPLVIGLFISFLKIERQKLVIWITLFSAFSFFVYKTMLLEESVSETKKTAQYPVITSVEVSQIENDCNAINIVCKENNVNLVMIVNIWSDNFINYGCQACDESFPPTLYPQNDRRTWRLLEEKDKINKTILFIGQNAMMRNIVEGTEKKDLMITSLGNRMYLLKNNTLTTMELLKRLKIEPRSF
jgi:hypothetical protein